MVRYDNIIFITELLLLIIHLISTCNSLSYLAIEATEVNYESTLTQPLTAINVFKIQLGGRAEL